MKSIIGLAVGAAVFVSQALAVELDQRADFQVRAQALGLSAAATYFCAGTITNIGIDNANIVWVNGLVPTGWLGICNTTQTLNNFSPESCRAIHASLLAAQVAQKSVTLALNDGGSCQSHAAWTIGGVFFLQTNN